MIMDLIRTAACLLRGNRPPCQTRPAGGPHSGPPTNPGDGGGPGDPGAPCCQQSDFVDSMPTACPGMDARCADPSFVQSNPALCPTSTRLILKPAYLLKEPLQQVAYEAVLLAGGVETVLGSGVTFQSSSSNVAVIGATSGKCSTVAAGICTVSASWGGMTAYAQVEVVPSCAAEMTDFILLLDSSLSMTSGFSSLYASKLDFAKQKATAFIDTIDLSKDRVAVYSVDGVTIQRLAFSQEAGAIKTAIAGIAGTTETTALREGLQRAVDFFNDQSTPQMVQCIVLFSDGENKTGGNPLPVASDFQGSNHVIFVVGVRAWGSGFTLLEAIASGGFFLNATLANQVQVNGWLRGLKGYICSGNCNVVQQDFCVPYAKLNYDGFLHWQVVSGVVDLIGDGGRPLFDLLPGNGLYVDLAGSSAPWKGHLTSKTIISFSTGQLYTLRLKLAGNQREDAGPYTVRVQVGTMLNEIITIDDWKQDFTAYTFNWAAGADEDAGIEISLKDVPAGGNPSFGPLLDSVVLYNGDEETGTLFADDFNGENVTCFNVCGSVVCPAKSDGGPYPTVLEIVDYSDTYFDAVPCLATPEMAGLGFCLAGAAWDGKLPQAAGYDPGSGVFSWQKTVASGVDDDVGTAGSLDGGKAIHFVGIDFNEDSDRWTMALTLRICDGAAVGSTSVVWQGEKCGNNPTGVYTKVGGCVERPTVEVRAPGQPDCLFAYGAQGCLDADPIPAQAPDPNPGNDLEVCPQNPSGGNGVLGGGGFTMGGLS